jgi:excisionase family DNA binding protein
LEEYRGTSPPQGLPQVIWPCGEEYIPVEFDHHNTQRNVHRVPLLDEAAMGKAALRISDLPVGKTKAYEEIHAGRLRAVKCGKLTLILAEDFERWLASLTPIIPNQSDTGTQRESGARTALGKSKVRHHSNHVHGVGSERVPQSAGRVE